MEKIYTDQDVKSGGLTDARVAVLGYGSQGRAHALNLRDSGLDVIVGARRGGPAERRAISDGFEVREIREAVAGARLVALLTPDMTHREVYEQSLAGALEPGASLLVAHGFSVHFGEIRPREDIDLLLVAPKGPGDLVRREYTRGRGVPCLFAVGHDASGEARNRVLAYAHGIGATRAGALQTTFAEETETDLFGEQAVLCGGLTELVVAGFGTLVEAGYKPEVAYFECLHEAKLIVDLLHEGGLAKMHRFISETAKYGDLISGPVVINDETRSRMKGILRDIQSGNFAKAWVAEHRAGKHRYNELLEADLDQEIERVGERLRAYMAWLEPAPTGQAA